MTRRSRALDPSPYARTAAALVNSGTPVIPAYSLFNCWATTVFSAVLTEGRTYGFPWSSLYAPTPAIELKLCQFISQILYVPKLIFSLKLSALKASVIPDMQLVKSNLAFSPATVTYPE